MYKLVVCDLDGTLLDAEHRLGGYTRQVLDALLARGIHLAFATGRHFVDVHRLSELLSHRPYLISSNGAAVHDRSARPLHCRPLPPESLSDLLHGPRFDGVHINVYRQHDWLVEEARPALLRFHRDSGFAYRVVDFRALDATPVLKVFYHHPDPARLAALEPEILARHGARVTTTFSLPMILEVMARGVSKGEALGRVRKALGLRPEEVIAFGDAPNDLEMLRGAGKGVLMANAAPELRAALPDLEVIGSHADEAVAHYLARWL
ncbi:Cof-type HAD-IIB family hydrolase [Thiococcus pfennigii]|jgi:Cof subfamily protein (haloacid dehalogenase superfamily)|uniref:Cof-type HAD-IIB family hydrolase n=1 Tax=Thiococcus pfennigii TaxID=1057 RepID=UPI00190673DE|nr:Cof-type HAD-IIB family hydrolase [Thiococcus pfennigii]MBK1731448.1 hydrolase Cof [Thiococcus pfennigii]